MTKIYLLEIMYKNDGSTGRATPFIEKKIISSLKIIGRVRNGFHHNLSHKKAFEHSSKDGAKFPLINKKLEEYSSINDFVNGFKSEVFELYENLNKIIMNMSKDEK